VADRSDRLPPYRRPEGAEDLFTPTAGITLPPDQPAPPPQPLSRREAREAARRGQGATPPAQTPWDATVSGRDDGPDGGPDERYDERYDEPDDVRHGRAARPSRPGRPWTVPLAALLLLAWAGTVFVDLGGLPGVVPVVLATLVPLVSVVAVPVATLAVRRRRWESAAAAVVAGLLPWVFVAGYATNAPAPPKQGDPVTVLVVNAHGGRADAEDIVAAVRTQTVDVLVVTELSRTLSNELSDAGLGTFLLPQWFRVEDAPDAGLGVWANSELAAPEVVSGTRWPAVSFRVPTRSGELRLVAGHVVPPVPARVDRWRSDLGRLGAAAAGTDHTMLVGTFNASPWNARYRSMLASAKLVDAADLQGGGLRPTWPTWTPLPLVPLDSALVTEDLHVVSADTVPLRGTDHRALLVTVEIPGDLTSAD
jgi:endonuclease/exonuclease/phosphatase (EEP) superfamily protein YafD